MEKERQKLDSSQRRSTRWIDGPRREAETRPTETRITPPAEVEQKLFESSHRGRNEGVTNTGWELTSKGAHSENQGGVQKGVIQVGVKSRDRTLPPSTNKNLVQPLQENSDFEAGPMKGIKRNLLKKKSDQLTTSRNNG